jgi:hypothetical protein
MAVPTTVGDAILSWSPAKDVTEWLIIQQVPIAKPIVSLVLNGQRDLVILPPMSRRKSKKITSN